MISHLFRCPCPHPSKLKFYEKELPFLWWCTFSIKKIYIYIIWYDSVKNSFPTKLQHLFSKFHRKITFSPNNLIIVYKYSFLINNSSRFKKKIKINFISGMSMNIRCRLLDSPVLTDLRKITKFHYVSTKNVNFLRSLIFRYFISPIKLSRAGKKIKPCIAPIIRIPRYMRK